MAKARRKEKLSVLQNGEMVGTLEQAANSAVSFQYETSWLEGDNAIPISLSLPLREDAYKGAEASYFFDNLLPDNKAIRIKIASRVGAQSERPFDLLSAIGHDCVGSLQFSNEFKPAETTPRIQKSTPLKKAEIAKILKGLGFFPLGMQADEPEFRLSIAGAQEKTALLRIEKNWFKPIGSTPSSHILKPPMGILHNGIDLTTSVENEWLCMQITKALGLEVAECEILNFGDQKCLGVKRFDRDWKTAKKLVRIPQEDFCQALGYPSSKKYQAEGGPSAVQIMNFLNGSDERKKDRAAFMRSQIVFFLLAATDGHAKNFSVFLTKSGFRMTPLYDIMTVFPAAQKRQIQFQKAKLAMSISKHYKIREIAPRHFEALAKESGFSIRELALIVDDVKARAATLPTKIKLPRCFNEEIFTITMAGLRKQLNRL